MYLPKCVPKNLCQLQISRRIQNYDCLRVSCHIIPSDDLYNAMVI